MKQGEQQQVRELLNLLGEELARAPPGPFHHILSAEIGNYRRLQALETSIDRALNQKRIQITESLTKNCTQIVCPLRLLVRVDLEPGEEQPVLRLQICGKVLTGGADPEVLKLPAFTELFRRLSVQFEGIQAEGAEFCAASKHEKRQRLDGFQLRRAVTAEDAGKDFRVNLVLVLEHSTALFSLNAPLQGLLGKAKANRREVTDCLFRHVKGCGLLEQDVIRVDELLQRALELPEGRSHLHVAELSGLVLAVLQPHALRLSAAFDAASAAPQLRAFETLVGLSLEETKEALVYFLPKISTYDMLKERRPAEQPNELLRLQAQLAEMDRGVARHFEALYAAYVQRLNLASMAANPAAFFKGFVASQHQGLAAIDAMREPGLARRGWSDENDFVKAVFESHGQFAQKEIAAYLAALKEGA